MGRTINIIDLHYSFRFCEWVASNYSFKNGKWVHSAKDPKLSENWHTTEALFDFWESKEEPQD